MVVVGFVGLGKIVVVDYFVICFVDVFVLDVFVVFGVYLVEFDVVVCGSVVYFDWYVY